MREAVENLVKMIVSEPESVEVGESEDRGTTRISVRVAAGDMGKLIGRDGRTIRALRSILHAVSQKQGRRYVLDVVE
jgi:predicted RNA-binding protein YlqC (UPF0109 family)